MAQLLSRVQPGDVITASMWNGAVDAINHLLQAGPTSGVTIAAVSPAGTSADPIRMNTPLQISGDNLGFSSGQARVLFEASFGTVVVTRDQMLTGSSDTRLLLIVPTMAAVRQSGMTMTLRVDNGAGSDTRSVLVMPVVIPVTGDMFVSWRADTSPNPKPNPLKISQVAEFALQLTTGVNMPATFALTADIQNATVAVPAGLVASIEFADENGTLIANQTVEMGKNDTRNIVVRIPQVPASFASQSFTLQVGANAGSVVGAFGRSFTVGTIVAATDPDIQPQLTGSLVLNAGGNIADPADGQLSGTTIKLKKDLMMVVMLNVKLIQAGSHDITIQAKQGTTLTGWSPQLANTPATIPGPDGGRLVQFSVQPSGAPTQSGTVVLRIKRQGAALDWFQEFDVQLLP